MTLSDLRTNLQNLAARALSGEWPRDDDLRNQILRCWKGAAFTPPASAGSGDCCGRYCCGHCAACGGGSTFADPRATGIQVDEAPPSGETVSATTMSEPTTPPAADACSMKRRHAVFSRRGDACPTCGWTRPEATA